MDHRLVYRKSGVNITAGQTLVKWLHQQSSLYQPKNTKTRKVLKTLPANIGAFCGLFPLFFTKIKKPFLAVSTDGVGTKLQLAEHFKSYKEVGQDLVAMCVNDVICCGASPLLFLDYYACSKLKQKDARDFLKGVLSACQKSSCLLLGGETAEMPGTYQKSHFDCAGFALGVVERAKILGSHKVKVNDILIGVSSSGFHSNGFSLLRKVFKKDLQKWRSELLKPTALYGGLAQKLCKGVELKAMAHITGGGVDNIQRVLPEDMKAQLKKWPLPSIFVEVQKRAKLSRTALLKILNGGVGLVLVAKETAGQKICQIIKEEGFKAIDLGKVIKK